MVVNEDWSLVFADNVKYRGKIASAFCRLRFSFTRVVCGWDSVEDRTEKPPPPFGVLPLEKRGRAFCPPLAVCGLEVGFFFDAVEHFFNVG